MKIQWIFGFGLLGFFGSRLLSWGQHFFKGAGLASTSGNRSDFGEMLKDLVPEDLLAHLLDGRLQLPNADIQDLVSLILDDRISNADFRTKVQQVFRKAPTLSWPSWLYQEKLNHGLVYGPSTSVKLLLGGVFLVLVLGVISKLLPPNFKSSPKLRSKLRKLSKKIKNEMEDFWIRIAAFLCYVFPLLSSCAHFWSLADIWASNNYAYGFPLPFPSFVFSLGQWFASLPTAWTYVYFFGSLLLMTKGYIRIRFLRFQIGRAFILMASTWNAQFLRRIFEKPTSQAMRQGSVDFGIVFLSACFVLGALWDAIRLKYPNNKILRDSVELHLGGEYRHGNPQAWWDEE